MPFAHRKCCACPCTGVAYFLFLDEASAENPSAHSEAMVGLCTILDEDSIHPFVPNSQTGLNYSSAPEGTTRVGLEMFCEIKDQDWTVQDKPSSPVCSDYGYGGRDIDHRAAAFEVEYTPYNISSDLLSIMAEHFGHPRPFHPSVFSGTPPEGIDPLTYINPYPTRICFLADDSGSHSVEDTDATMSSMKSYLQGQWGSDEVNKRFNMLECRGATQQSPIPFAGFTDVSETWTYPLYKFMEAIFPNQFDESTP